MLSVLYSLFQASLKITVFLGGLILKIIGALVLLVLLIIYIIKRRTNA